MKKITVYVMALCMSVTFLPLLSNAASTDPATGIVVTAPPGDPNTMMVRLNEIRAMDKTNLSSSEKRTLRKEVRSLKHGLKQQGRYVYISVGAAIIIVLLLIILL